MHVTYKFRVPCAIENLKSIRNFVNNLTCTGLSISELKLVVLAIDEVCANLFIHSHSCNSEDRIELKIVNRHDGIGVEIVDFAKGFDIGSYKEPELENVIVNRQSGGMGLILVKRIMDEVSYEQIGSRAIYKLFKANSVSNTQQLTSAV